MRAGSHSRRPFQYLDVIVRAWGTWALFQSLLAVLHEIGSRHGRSIANIATRWVLDHPFVGAVIIGTCNLWPCSFFFSSKRRFIFAIFFVLGARLGISEHQNDNLQIFGFSLSEADNRDIEAVLARSNGRQMITTIGDCGAEYR